MNQAGNVTASSGLFQMEVCGAQGKENCIGNLLLPPPLHSEPTPLCWAATQPKDGEGRRQGSIKQSPSISYPMCQSPEMHHL